MLRLLDGLWNIGHIVVMEFFFTYIGLFSDLLALSTYAIRTVRLNRVELSLDLRNARAFKNVPQGITLWKM